jgi:hypothetical protein
MPLEIIYLELWLPWFPYHARYSYTRNRCEHFELGVTRCIALLVYLITFKVLKQSTINQKTKRYYNPLDLNFIKIHPFDQTLSTRCKLVILNVFIGQFWIFGHYRTWSMAATEHGTACSAVCSVQKFKIDQSGMIRKSGESQLQIDNFKWHLPLTYTYCLETIWNFLEKIHAFYNF